MINKNNESNTFRTQVHHEAENLSHDAKQRLRWMNHFKKYRNARLTCRHFGISPDTFYLWKKRFDPSNFQTLEDDFKTRRPRRVRISRHKALQLETIRKLKSKNPQFGKIKIAKIIKKTGYRISSSTVGRLLEDRKS
jgi:putative transposase